MYYLLKVALSAVVIVAVSEVAKRSSLFGALIASLPLTSLLAIVWMRVEHQSNETIAQLSTSVFWLVIPSLVFFVLFPMLLNKGLHFWLSFFASAAGTVVTYFAMVRVLAVFDVQL